MPDTAAARAARLPHTHTPGDALHDDHTCPCVRCTTCGKPGRLDNGTWRDVDALRQA